MEQAITISQLAKLADVSSEYCRLENDYILARLQGGIKAERFFNNTPMRVDGMTFLLSRQGTMSVEVNLEQYELKGNSFLGIGPDHIVSVRHLDAGAFDGYLLFLSHRFLSETNIDINMIDFSIDFEPVLLMNDTDVEMVESYLRLIRDNTVNNDANYARSISRVLVAGLCYQLMQFSARRASASESNRPRSRRVLYVHEFRSLVHKYHRRERSVAFYASKMFISPKYLSLVIKETTGRSAVEWIDDYVILEAKNLLRFSGKNIQQVAYELNFPNQSAFGKYFKHLTGMSPTAYQRS